MLNRTKMLLVPCSGEETLELSRDIEKILHQDYGLEVESLESIRRCQVGKDTPKDHLHPLVSDYFPDVEVQVDIGRNSLKDIIRGKHVVLVEHLLTPKRLVSPDDTQRVSVNDHLMTIRGFLDVISKAESKDEKIPQITLAVPYLSYVRSHSIEKYEKRGFFQLDSLRKTLDDYRADGLGALVTIDPHSEKAAQIAGELGLDFHIINPFQSARAINPAKLGLSGKKAKEMIRRIRPFQERFNQLKPLNKEHLYVVSVDDGTEKRAENFVERAFPELSPEDVYSLMAYFDKDRVSYEQASTKFKPFSQVNENSFDKEGTYVIIDDMFSSGGTANKVAKILKGQGAKKVEVWTSHAVTMPAQYGKANDRTYIDEVVCLDTVAQHSDLKISYLKASADLLASELYKTHHRLITSR
ncbi:MAG: phosphoribosyltransferase family protein [Nanoarchaeota archaeon]